MRASARRRREMKRAVGVQKLSATSGPFTLEATAFVHEEIILHDGIRLEQSKKLILSIAIGHAGHVIADGSFRPFVPDAPAITLRQQTRHATKFIKELTNDPAAFDRHALDAIVVVHTAVQKLLQLRLERAHVGAWFNQRSRSAADIDDRMDAFLAQPLAGVFEQIAHLPIDEMPNHRGLKLLRSQFAMALMNLIENTPPKGDFIQLGGRDKADAERVVDVVSVVGETIG